MSCAPPPGYEIPPDIIAGQQESIVLEQLARSTAAVTNADAVYTDVWTSMGQEDESQQRRTAFEVSW